MSLSAQEDTIGQLQNLKLNYEVIHREFEAVRRALQNIEEYAQGSKRAECQRMLEDWNRLHEVRSKCSNRIFVLAPLENSHARLT